MSNFATAKIERLGIAARRSYISQKASNSRNWLAVAWVQDVRSAARCSPRLDVVLGCAALSVEILVERLCLPARPIGEDEAVSVPGVPHRRRL